MSRRNQKKNHLNEESKMAKNGQNSKNEVAQTVQMRENGPKLTNKI